MYWFLSKATHISIWVFLFNFERMETSKVIRAFTCVNSRVHYAVGSTYEADAARINHLVTKGYVTALPKAHIPKEEVTAPSKAEVTHTPKKKRNEHK